MIQPGRKYSQSGKYRYGFNGKENDSDVKGEGNQQDYGMRIYDPRLGRFLSEDPITKEYPELTPYQFASNSPIINVDLDGLESFNAWKLAQIKNTPPKKTTAADISNTSTLKFSKAKISAKAEYTSTGGGILLDVLSNSKEYGTNVGVSAWNGLIGQAEDVSNLIFSSSGRKAVLDEYSTAALNAMIWNGTTTPQEKLEETKSYLSDVENLESLGGIGILSLIPSFPKILPKLKIPSAIKSSTISVAKVTLPKGWITKPSKKGGGIVFQDPANLHNSIRQMPGNPSSPNIQQQNPYIIFKKNGIAHDVNGNPLKSATDPAAHIPAAQFDINKMPKF